jgi:hypothetical protein
LTSFTPNPSQLQMLLGILAARGCVHGWVLKRRRALNLSPQASLACAIAPNCCTASLVPTIFKTERNAPRQAVRVVTVR